MAKNKKRHTPCVSVRLAYYRELRATMDESGIKIPMAKLVAELINGKLDELEAASQKDRSDGQ